jgi:2-polyprenyl-3-methyl-5-hydroxy-6-metoxy-1,4-benzoquinol methylase
MPNETLQPTLPPFRASQGSPAQGGSEAKRVVRQADQVSKTKMNEAPRPEFPKEITRYYQEVAEEERLALGPSQLEFARTKESVLRHLPAAPATILDVGGAAGAYALWLAEMGYQVHLIDPVLRLVEEARRRSEASPNRICTCQVGDARELTFSDGVAHGVLLLGPLYHLTDSADRLRAPGGIPRAPARWRDVCRTDFALRCRA